MNTLLSMTLVAAFGVPPQDDAGGAALAPFVGDEAFAVLHVDLAGLDLDGLAEKVLSGVLEPGEIDEATRGVGAWVESLRGAGARSFSLVVDPADLPGMPSAIVTLADGADAEEIGRILCGGGEAEPLIAWPTCAVIRGVVFAGSDAALERARRPNPAPRPELAAALAASGDGPARLVIIPSANQRRVAEELMPVLPDSFGGAPITTLTRGMRWAAVTLEDRPGPTLRAVVRSADAGAALAFAEWSRGALGLLGERLRGDDALRDVAEGLARIEVDQAGDRVTIAADLKEAGALIGAPVRQARAAARRAQSTNQLKMIALAMHNYASEHDGTFPPAYTADEDGKPLLSWRVHILPYLEQKSLYDAFRLDEPWDSPHNAALIERMPEAYRSPTVAEAGRTTFLVPRGEATIFPGAGGISLKEITDGTSNTFLVVDVNDPNAVPWTKPDDWEVGETPDAAALFGKYLGGTNAAFADGSVRFIRDAIAPETLRKLVTRAGGEVFSTNDL